MKTLFTGAFIIATIAMGAQEQKLKKACIKMESDEKGKITKIDTCVTAATEAELQEKLRGLGMGEMPIPPAPPLPPNMPEIPSMDIRIDSIPGNGYTYVYTTTSEGEDGEEKAGKKAGARKKTRIVTRPGGKDSDAQVIIVDDAGNITRAGSGDHTQVVVKTYKPGEQMDEEIERLLKERGSEKGDQEGKRVVIVKSQDTKEGKEQKDVKVYVFRKMEVKKLSEAEKKKLPAEAVKSIQGADLFEDLNVAPNPTEDACTISYKSGSSAPLHIRVYNEEGKTVLTETDNHGGDQVNKTLSLKDLGRGTYFVHITQGRKSEIRKVIVR